MKAGAITSSGFDWRVRVEQVTLMASTFEEERALSLLTRVFTDPCDGEISIEVDGELATIRCARDNHPTTFDEGSDEECQDQDH